MVLRASLFIEFSLRTRCESKVVPVISSSTNVFAMLSSLKMKDAHDLTPDFLTRPLWSKNKNTTIFQQLQKKIIPHWLRNWKPNPSLPETLSKRIRSSLFPSRTLTGTGSCFGRTFCTCGKFLRCRFHSIHHQCLHFQGCPFWKRNGHRERKVLLSEKNENKCYLTSRPHSSTEREKCARMSFVTYYFSWVANFPASVLWRFSLVAFRSHVLGNL